MTHFGAIAIAAATNWGSEQLIIGFDRRPHAIADGENCGGIRGHTPIPPRQPSPAVLSFFMALLSFADSAPRAYRLKAGNDLHISVVS
jgi:hypothetical protein